MTTIYFPYLSTLTASNLESIAVACPKLRHLDFRACDQILSPLEGLDSIAELIALIMEKAVFECKKKLSCRACLG